MTMESGDFAGGDIEFRLLVKFPNISWLMQVKYQFC